MRFYPNLWVWRLLGFVLVERKKNRKSRGEMSSLKNRVEKKKMK